MADIALTTAAEVSIVESTKQATLPAGEAITPGAPVRISTTGYFVNGNATDTTENAIYGIATGKRAVIAGEMVTAVRIGVLSGFTLTSQAYGAPIFVSDTDARLADAAGTTVLVAGHVIPAWGQLLGGSPDKLLDVCIVDDLAYVDTTE
ncbi:MAG: hypothetical protein AB7R89_13690 [Dehalococcoidia bacterium]